MRTATAAALLTTAVLALPAPARAAVAGTGTGSGHLTVTRATQVTPRSDAWEARVLVLTNDRRRAHHLRPLRASACADRYAEPWTEHLATARVLVHQDLSPLLSCPHTSYAGENIADGYSTPRALVSAWMHSAGHRANILSTHFHRLGVAGWVSTDGVTYATQDFLG
jgi:uncharacterized protein YkwD